MVDVPNQNGLGGKGYSWIDRNGDGKFQPGEEGNQLFAFGGSITSVDPKLKRPRTDEVTAGVDLLVPQSIKPHNYGGLPRGRHPIPTHRIGTPLPTGGTPPPPPHPR